MAQAGSARDRRDVQDSRIEDEPLLGPVLKLPDGSMRRLSWHERVLVALRLTDAPSLAARQQRAQTAAR